MLTMTCVTIMAFLMSLEAFFQIQKLSELTITNTQDRFYSKVILNELLDYVGESINAADITNSS